VLGVGEAFSPDRPLAVVHASSAVQAEQAAREVATAFDWVDESVPVAPAPLVVELLTPSA